jgi:hypothetical protein
MLYGFKVHLLSVNRQLDAEEKAKGVEKQGFRYIV